jgi:hypothetical protein
MSTLMIGTQQGHRNNRKAILNPTYKFNYHVRVQAALDREHD